MGTTALRPDTQMSLRVAIGTYDKQVCGVDWPPGEEEPSTLFAFTAHLGCVKVLASCGKYFVSGATDEQIRVFNLDTLIDLGTLYEHTGTITALAFHKKQHMFSGSEDGSICIWRCKDWEMLTSLKAQEPVVDIALHPSGRMLIATYKNRMVRLWDLLKGRCSWKKHVPAIGSQVVWAASPKTEFAVVTGKNVLCYMDGDIQHTMEHQSVVQSVAYVEDMQILVTGTAEGRIHIWSCSEGVCTASVAAHQSRIRSVLIHDLEGVTYMVSADTEGILKMWEIVSPKLLRIVQETDLDSRITSLCICHETKSTHVATQKTKKTKQANQTEQQEEPAPKSILKTKKKKSRPIEEEDQATETPKPSKKKKPSTEGKKKKPSTEVKKKPSTEVKKKPSTEVKKKRKKVAMQE